MTIEIDQGNREMSIQQKDYSMKILEIFKVEDSKAQNALMLTRQVVNRENRKRQAEQNIKDTEKFINVPFREPIENVLHMRDIRQLRCNDRCNFERFSRFNFERWICNKII